VLAAIALAAVLAANPAPAPAAAPQKSSLKLGAPGLKSVGLAAETAAFYGDHLAQQLSLAGARVITPSEIQALLGVERQKQLLGCSDEGSSCMTELAGALGVDGLLTGTVARVGRGFQVNVKVLDTLTGATLSVVSAQAESEQELIDQLNRVAKALASELFVKLDRAPVISSASRALEGGEMRRRAWIPAVGGAAALGVGLGLALDAQRKYDSLLSGTETLADPQGVRRNGQLAENVSIGLFAVGGAALVSAGLMYFLGGPTEPQLYVAPVAGGGGMLSISGELP
jgi:hypothetical protein